MMGLLFYTGGDVQLDETSKEKARRRAITDLIAAHLDEYKRLEAWHSFALRKSLLIELRASAPGAMAEREKAAGRKGRTRPNTR